ncbi:hypothetical protein Kpho02_75540 [Kitasatospora phosalacinea]|uniref:Uncharacterized protein n=1 Tax=Kitasatospora phosalacinea TaxID=2065 RepID=A0A9W6V7H6_9ACTN|nr:hypothetical protein Kpho02_75540 [Kitasatospora phosalacinea]
MASKAAPSGRPQERARSRTYPAEAATGADEAVTASVPAERNLAADGGPRKVPGWGDSSRVPCVIYSPPKPGSVATTPRTEGRREGPFCGTGGQEAGIRTVSTM